MSDQYESFLQGGDMTAAQNKGTNNKHKAAHARVGSTLTNGGENEAPPQTQRDMNNQSNKKHNTIAKPRQDDDTIDRLDKEVEAITKKAKKSDPLNVGGGGGLGGLEVGDGVDFAAAGVKDLNNFKGYHNQEDHKNEEDERYTDPQTGAHFEFADISKRMVRLMKNREQEQKIYQLTGVKETLDSSYYQYTTEPSRNKQYSQSILKAKRASDVLMGAG